MRISKRKISLAKCSGNHGSFKKLKYRLVQRKGNIFIRVGKL